MNLCFVLVLPLVASAFSWFSGGKKVAPVVTLLSCLTLFVLALVDSGIVIRGIMVVGITDWLALDGLSALMLFIVSWSALIASSSP